MNPERWARVRGVFDSALEQDPAQRTAFLQQACSGDQELLAEVRSLLASLDESTKFMDHPLTPAVALSQQIDHVAGLEGSSVGPYKLLRRVGTGGMASVYAAIRVDQHFHKIVALKLVKPGMDSEEILRRFCNERQVLAGLEHSHIARLLDGGTTERGLPYLVMEYVEGTPLDRHCDAHKLSVTERLIMFRTVCSAVQYAHQNLVVHRDIKPSNILVTPQGVPKLLDFGIAKLLRPDYSGDGVNLTRADLRPMTPEYASPEQMRGDPITTASDVYSLGVLLYELLTGHLPYRLKSHSPTELAQAVCEWEPERPSLAIMRVEPAPASNAATTLTPEVVSERREGRPDKLRRRLHGDLDMILLTALRKEPQRRYGSVEQFSQDIKRHLDGRPVSARKDVWTYRTAKFTRRHAAGLAVTFLVALALIVSTAVSVYYAREAQQQKAMALQLAGILFEFDTSVRSGLTQARKDFLDKVLDHLSQFSPNAAKDPALRKLLTEGYFRAGDLQGNLWGPNLGDKAGAKESYEKALALAEAAVRYDPADGASQRDLAQARRRLGDLAANGGDRRTALELYRKTREVFQSVLSSDPRRPQSIKDVMDIDLKIGSTQSHLGDMPGALESYRRYLQLAEQWSAVQGRTAEARRAVAAGQERVGEILANSGSTAEGLHSLRQALVTYDELLAGDPANILLQRDVSSAALILGGLLSNSGMLPQAEASYRKGLQMLDPLITSDPRNQQYKRDLNSALFGLADVLWHRGHVREARQFTERSLEVLRPLVNQTDALPHDIQQYCWLLLNTPFKDLRDAPVALLYARKLVTLRGKDPSALDVLALAYEANGDMAHAVEAEHQALNLLPPPEPGAVASSWRQEFETNLNRFEGKLAR